MSTVIEAPAPARSHALGFWLVGAAFLVTMGFSAVPTPLYVLYQDRDHFSTIVVTIVFAVYAVGVVASLFLAGHWSDAVGRKRVLVTALLLDVASAAVFLVAPSLPGLIVARLICGAAVGLATATATAYLRELQPDARRAELTATAANLGGIGLGPLVAGILAQYAPDPLRLPYLILGLALLVLAGLLAVAPETAPRPAVRPPWRPQRIAVPDHARGTFFAATSAALAAFAVYGSFNALVPTFLAGTLHETSHAVAGAVVFVAFAAGAVAQLFGYRLAGRAALTVGVPPMVLGLALLCAGTWLASLALFLAGAVLAGAGGGLVFRGALMVTAASAPAHARAEVLSGFFLGAYIGLSVPVIGLGVAVHYASVRLALPVFAALIAVAVVGTARAAAGRAG